MTNRSVNDEMKTMKTRKTRKIKWAAVPFEDVYGRRRWAKDPVFDGYLALVPVKALDGGEINWRFVTAERRRNLRHVLELAIDELKAETRQKATSRELRRRIRRLRRLRKLLRGSLKLPSEIRVHYAVKRRHGYKAVDGSTVFTHSDAPTPRVRWVDLDELVRYGLDESLSRASMPWRREAEDIDEEVAHEEAN